MVFVPPDSSAAQSLIRRDIQDIGVSADVVVQRNYRPDKEYVAAGGYGVQITDSSVKILSTQMDELMRMFGPRIYKHMLCDAKVFKCYTVLRTYVLSDGPQITPGVPKQDKRYAQALEYSDFANRAINNLSKPLTDTLEQLLEALIYGHKVAEITYDEVPVEQGRRLLKHIKIKSQGSVAFVVDKFKNVIGFKVANDQPKSGKFRVIPREKFVVLTIRAEDDDPRGTSILKGAYNAWHMKMLAWPIYLRWLETCTVPGLVGITSEENDGKNYVLNADGSIATDPSGNPIFIPATSQLATALSQMKNGSVVAIPHGSDVKVISSNASSEPFKTARDVYNEEIEMSLLLQTLATSDSRHNTRAASETHMSVLDILVYHLKSILAETIKRDVITNLITYNFPNVDMELIPKVTMGDSERRLWANDIGAASTAYTAGLIKESQLPGIHNQMGLEPMDPDDVGMTPTLKLEQEKAKNAALVAKTTKIGEKNAS